LPLEVRKPGDTLEGFRVIAELGRGAASVIYLVQDPKTKQVWALKQVVREDEKSERFIQQAEQECAVSSKLDSPKIRKVERVIKKKEGLLGGTTNELYLVMEHVDGSSCERRPPTTFETAVGIFEQVAQGLAYMHSRGFVHADMKPNNIIVDDVGNAKIIDLGQSCKIGTVKQRIQGTPDYIAPEQVHRRAITPKTDVYNLGASLYWVFTRQFIPTALSKGDSLLGSVDDSLLQKPKRPGEMNPRVPPMLDELIMQCVEVEPDKRPSMDAVADRLNLIRSKLIAENELRKSGVLRIDAPGGSGGSRAGSNGSRGGVPGGPGGTNIHDAPAGGSTGVGVAGKVSPRPPEPPPIDPGPGIAEADD
jgi:serine/threonine-protein kinase